MRRLQKPVPARRSIHVTLEPEQWEMVEKLCFFFGREKGRPLSRRRVLEEAVRTFTDDSADYITETYGFDIRSATLTDMRQMLTSGGVLVAAFDTVVLPARDNAACRRALFEEHVWYPVQLNSEKLAQLQYMAVYMGAPCSGITHYARITSYEPAPNAPGKHLLRFEPPEELPAKVPPGGLYSGGIRRPRYTTLQLLLEARTIEDLF